MIFPFPFPLLALLLLPLTFAQFGNFFQGGGFPFGGHMHQQHQQQQQGGGGRQHKGWNAMDEGGFYLSLVSCLFLLICIFIFIFQKVIVESFSD